MHNLLSDAFVAANLNEMEYKITLTQHSSRRIYILICKNGSNEMMMVHLSHDSDGYLRSVRAIENTLLPEEACNSFLNCIYDEEFIYL